MKEKQSGIPKYLIGSLFVLFVVIVALIFLFMRSNHNRIVDQNQQYLESTAEQTTKYIKEVFDSAFRSVVMVSHMYEMQLDTPEFDYRMLNEISEPTPFEYIRFVGLDGISWSGEGATIDCSDREYYLKGTKGASGFCYVSKSRFTTEELLICYTPLYFDGEIIGVVNGVLNIDELSKRLENSLFGTQSDICIVDQEGTVVAASWNKTGNFKELWGTMTSDSTKRDATWNEVMQVLKNGRFMSFRYSGQVGTGNAYIAPLLEGKFMLVQTFPSQVTQSITGRANRDALKLEGALIVAFLIYVIQLGFFYISRNKKLSIEKEDLGQIVDSVKRLYRRFVVIDLDADTYEYLQEGDISELNLPPEGKYSDWLELIRQRNEESPKHWGPMKDMTVEHLKQTLTKENWYSHREYSTPSGRWERLSILRLDLDSDEASRVLGAVEDITEIKQRDEESRLALEAAFRTAESASRAKSDFLSRMSHDIRTPMNAIVGLTAIMGTHLDDRDRIVDCLTKITSSSKHLLGLINEVLDMSKIESGKLVLSQAEFSLSGLVDDLLGIVQPMVNAKHQELTVHIQNMGHENVIGDSLRLQQVLVNILSNAVKYTEENGHIKVSITEKPSRSPQLGEFEFVVEDDGIGMTQEFLEKLYTPFERAEDDRISKIQGTGLGLAIAQSIVRLMGGTITAESELGKGTCFKVVVNLKLQEEDEEAAEQLAGLPVLVADDDKIACETTCLLLGELGMHGEWVLTGREAVEHVKTHHLEKRDYFAVILDWKMPGMDGLQTAKAIRQEVGPDIPIIILSAYDWSEIESEARAAGVDAFIAKPLFKSRLRGLFVSLRTGGSLEVTDPLRAIRDRDFKGKKVLLVEDNDLNQEIAKEIFEMIGLVVEVAENGKVAVEMFEKSAENEYELVFMDIQMPIMNGYEATRAIRALQRADVKDVPIIAMTANTFSEDVQAAMDAGMNQHIGKPLVMDQLMAVLEKWLG